MGRGDAGIVPDAVWSDPGSSGSSDPEDVWMRLEEVEERLEAEFVQVQGLGPLICVWYTCPDVCPPGG